MEKHSDSVWHSNGNCVYIAGRLVATTGDHANRTPKEEQFATAALIVRAVNAHADLVAALEFCAASFDPDTDALIQPRRKDMLSNIRAALAKAKA